MTHYYSSFSTPCGKFTVAVDEDGAVVATAFGGVEAVRGRFRAGRLLPDDRRTRTAREQVEAYFAGSGDHFTVATVAAGSEFQHRVWRALRAIPRGETRSYGELARLLGSSPRAIGRANATNPICLIVPCHRVIGGDGSMTGFAFGEAIKRQLLEREGALVEV